LKNKNEKKRFKSKKVNHKCGFYKHNFIISKKSMMQNILKKTQFQYINISSSEPFIDAFSNAFTQSELRITNVKKLKFCTILNNNFYYC
jgi:hypothetical protein